MALNRILCRGACLTAIHFHPARSVHCARVAINASPIRVTAAGFSSISPPATSKRKMVSINKLFA